MWGTSSHGLGHLSSGLPDGVRWGYRWEPGSSSQASQAPKHKGGQVLWP